MRLYHGTDLDSASALLSGEPLDADKAARIKIDGPLGFFLATELPDAEFFALRQTRGRPAVIAFDLSQNASEMLSGAGAIRRPIPRGPRSPWFVGDEVVVLPDSFDHFDALRRSGEIVAASIED